MSKHTSISTPHKEGAALPPGGPKRRTTPKTKRAIHLIATQGKTQRQAAQDVGMDEHALSRALAQPHNRALLDEAKALACMEIESLKGIAKAIAVREGIDLMQTSPSHPVRAKLIEFFAGEGRQALVNITLPGNEPPATGYQYRRPDAARPDSLSGVEDAQVVDNAGKED
jgi:transposase-like protein